MEFYRLEKPGEEDDRAEAALREIETACRVRLTVHDLRGLLRRADGSLLLPGRHLHPHPCCLRGRFAEPAWGVKCYRDCYTESEKAAARELKPFLKTCWTGLTELVTPVVCDGQHLLTIYAGVFRADAVPPPSAPEQRWFHELYAELPPPAPTDLLKLAPLLELTGQGIITAARRAREQEAGPDSRAAAIAGFIVDHAHRPVSLGELAQSLHLSVTRAGHVVRELTGHSFQELLIRERMFRARALLLSSGHKLEEVAAATGFKNGYYFNRAFKRFFGATPGRIRRQEP